jgi:type IV secretion system protein VirB10
MSQNIPPNQGQGQDQGYNPYEQAAGQQPAGNSPYTYQQSTAPDLDANAPTLKSHELQKLNRKALFFLAGIVGLLLIVAFWLLSRAGSEDQEATAKTERQEVTVPEIPSLPPLPPPETNPIAVEPTPTVIQPVELPPPIEDGSNVVAVDQGPTLMQRRMGAGGAQGSDEAGGLEQDPIMQALLAQASGAEGATAAQGQSSQSKATSAQFLNNPDSLMVRGTYIRCILETRIITDVPGFTSCIVTEPVYSINGRRLLLPKGSKVYGSYDVEDPKFPRVAVVWDRITTPAGMDISMESPGVDNLGSAGHPGQYNSHWGSKITSALLVSLVSDVFKYAGEKNGPRTTEVTTGGVVVSTPYQSNTARTIERMAEQVVDRNLSRPATVTINQGTLVNVYVAKDVSFAGVVGR